MFFFKEEFGMSGVPELVHTWQGGVLHPGRCEGDDLEFKDLLSGFTDTAFYINIM